MLLGHSKLTNGGTLIPVKNPSLRPVIRVVTKTLSGCSANSIASLSVSMGEGVTVSPPIESLVGSVRVAVCRPVQLLCLSH